MPQAVDRAIPNRDRTNGEPKRENTADAALRRIGHDCAMLTAHEFRATAPPCCTGKGGLSLRAPQQGGVWSEPVMLDENLIVSVRTLKLSVLEDLQGLRLGGVSGHIDRLLEPAIEVDGRLSEYGGKVP